MYFSGYFRFSSPYYNPFFKTKQQMAHSINNKLITQSCNALFQLNYQEADINFSIHASYCHSTYTNKTFYSHLNKGMLSILSSLSAIRLYLIFNVRRFVVFSGRTASPLDCLIKHSFICSIFFSHYVVILAYALTSPTLFFQDLLYFLLAVGIVDHNITNIIHRQYK